MTDSRAVPPRRPNPIEREEEKARQFFFREEVKEVVASLRTVTCGVYFGEAWSDERGVLEPCRLPAGHAGDHDAHPATHPGPADHAAQEI